MKNIGKFFSGLIIIIVSALISGFVFSILWHWFIVSTFNIKNITVIQSIGIAYFWGYLKTFVKKEEEKKDEMKELFESIATQIIHSGIALIFGWIIYQFI